MGADVLRIKGCVAGVNFYGAGTIALLTHRSPINSKGGDAAGPKKSEFASRASGCQHYRCRHPKGGRACVGVVTP